MIVLGFTNLTDYFHIVITYKFLNMFTKKKKNLQVATIVIQPLGSTMV